MVDVWAEAREKGIKITKYRIKHAEKHGMGDMAIHEKKILQKQERHRDLMRAKK